jgi:hypothetical protein
MINFDIFFYYTVIFLFQNVEKLLHFIISEGLSTFGRFFNILEKENYSIVKKNVKIYHY